MVLTERPNGAVSRAFKLPQAVDAEQANARHEHGVLTLTLPKRTLLRRSASPSTDDCSGGVRRALAVATRRYPGTSVLPEAAFNGGFRAGANSRLAAISGPKSLPEQGLLQQAIRWQPPLPVTRRHRFARVSIGDRKARCAILLPRRRTPHLQASLCATSVPPRRRLPGPYRLTSQPS